MSWIRDTEKNFPRNEDQIQQHWLGVRICTVIVTGTIKYITAQFSCVSVLNVVMQIYIEVLWTDPHQDPKLTESWYVRIRKWNKLCWVHKTDKSSTKFDNLSSMDWPV